MNEENSKELEGVSLKSRRKWLWAGILVALVNPIFSGLILGIAYWTEKDLRKEGRIILLIAVVWGLSVIYLSRWLVSQGYLPVL